MTTASALQKYTNAVDKRNDHIAQNKGVFDAHEKIVGEVIDAENELRDEVAASGEGIENGLYKVTTTPQTQEIYDESKVLAALGMTKDVAIEKGLIVINQRPARITISALNR